MPVPLDYLAGNGRRLQAKSGADRFFKLRTQVRQRSDCARYFSDAHVLGGVFKAHDVALGLRIPVGQLESEGRRLSVYTMSATDRRGLLKFKCAPLENGLQGLKIIADDQRGFVDLQRLGGIDHVVRGQAEVQPA